MNVRAPHTTRTSRISRKRTVLFAATAAAAALSVAVVTPALAGTSSHPATTAHSAAAAPAAKTGDPRSTTDRVANFYGAYIDSVWANEDPAAGGQAKALRAFYLSAAAQKKVAAFEEKEHADGILFAQNVPVKWKVTYTGSGAGHATSLVTLTWSDGPSAEVSKIKVQSDLRTQKITDLAPAE
ncbi:hypothetical protein ABZS76_16705 [Streptomyces sp. NPDC005562]|uniref:hypothetical protein n=1 Tax=unclassified Streptomyces TaxID=2593676 RepID=UPI0033A0AD2C